jgi:hypothetical protein
MQSQYAKGNLVGPAAKVRKVVRGDSWDENRPSLRSLFRDLKPLESGDSVYGATRFSLRALSLLGKKFEY